jgi:hypothetical protein
MRKTTTVAFAEEDAALAEALLASINEARGISSGV